MARPARPDSASVPIDLQVCEADAERIDQVLTRPEFAGWTRGEWCREIIRTALRYYVGEAPSCDSGHARTSARPAAAPPASPIPAAVPTGATRPPAADGVSGRAVPPAASVPAPAVPEPRDRPECPHPSAARDYETGTCAACGAILWD